MSLKAYSYLTLRETALWLKINLKKVGLDGGVKASKIIQDLTYQAKNLGTPGNDIQVEYIAGGTAGSEVVTVTGKLISVAIDDTVSTAAQIKAAIDASASAIALVSVSVSGVGSNAQTIVIANNLTGGAFDSTYDANLTEVLEGLIDAACEKVENLIQCPVLVREYTNEEHDGSNSNVIKPHQWPVREITELRIDYNRAFGSTSVLDDSLYLIRGGSDRRQTGTNPEITIGNDIVLRDDNERFILGRMFSGSVVGSIRITYKAGWSYSSDNVPSDIRLATKMLLEFWYMQRENRDIGVKTKGVKGESYTRLSEGIPTQITEMLEQYKDVSFGTRPMPQRNFFSI